MRLLHTNKIQPIEVYGQLVPPYAVLSHTWGVEEVTLQDLQQLSRQYDEWADEAVVAMERFDKIRKCAELAARDGIEYVWIDTCCIDKTSSSELSEAINSMYRWYKEAEICYAYLADVKPSSEEDIFDKSSSFRTSRWFTRGWTLQELIAPSDVCFFAGDWSYLGNKQQSNNFTDLLNSVTGVHREVLAGVLAPADISIASRMRWAAFRKTTRVEDVAYCLLGIFNVNIPLLYGEGESSFIRLQEAILLKDDDQSLFAWHSDEDGDDDDAQAPALSSRMCGLLARSPDQFWDAGDISYAMPLNFLASPAAVTSKGLQVDLHLRECRKIVGADYAVTLSCERVVDGNRVAPVLYLRRLWGQGDQFGRVFAGKRTFERPNPIVGIDSTDMTSQGFYETIFVRQQPSASLPLIRISPAKEAFPLMPSNAETVQWKVKEAYPQAIWNERGQCLETRDFRVGAAIGVFRITVGEIATPLVMDLAVGMHIINQRSCRSWCHLMQPGSSGRKLEDVFEIVNRDHRSLDIQYQPVSAAQVGIDLHLTGAVSEGYGQRSLTVSLHVFSRGKWPEQQPESGPSPQGPTVPADQPDHESPQLGKDETAGTEWIAGDKFIVDAIPDTATGGASEGRGKDGEKRTIEPSPDAAGVGASKVDQQSIAVPPLTQLSIRELLVDMTIVDSLEVSVFQRVRVGSKVRTVPNSMRKQTGTPVQGLADYCTATIPSVDDDSWNLARACLNGNVDEILQMVGGRLIDDEDEPDSFLQFRPLHWAVLSGRLPAVLALLSKTSPLRASGRRLTPIHLAALMGQTRMLPVMLAVVDNVETDAVTGSNNGTMNIYDHPIHLAAAHATNREFWYHAERMDTVRSFLDAGFTYNGLGETPLHRAAAMQNVPAVKYLMRHCLSDTAFSSARAINAVDRRGRTALWHAACADSREIVNLLLSAGAFLNLAGDEGLTPVHVACREGRAESLDALLRGGADPSLLTNSVPLLPSHIACIYGHDICLDLLLEYNGKTALTDDSGMYFDALHFAIANRQERCAQVISALQPSEFSGWSHCVVFEAGKPFVRRKWVVTRPDIWWAHDSPPLPAGVTATGTGVTQPQADVRDEERQDGRSTSPIAIRPLPIGLIPSRPRELPELPELSSTPAGHGLAPDYSGDAKREGKVSSVFARFIRRTGKKSE